MHGTELTGIMQWIWLFITSPAAIKAWVRLEHSALHDQPLVRCTPNQYINGADRTIGSF